MYQDRLGTNIGKALKKEMRFRIGTKLGLSSVRAGENTQLALTLARTKGLKSIECSRLFARQGCHRQQNQDRLEIRMILSSCGCFVVVIAFQQEQTSELAIPWMGTYWSRQFALVDYPNQCNGKTGACTGESTHLLRHVALQMIVEFTKPGSGQT
jgi:hypothetical protein